MMGMFDYVDCKRPLPDGLPQPKALFQTKAFDEPYLDTYVITEKGRLVRQDYREELVPEKERPHYGKPGFYNDDGSLGALAFCGSVRRVPLGERDLGFHGVLNFYDYNQTTKTWREFDAKFTDGQLVAIEQVAP